MTRKAIRDQVRANLGDAGITFYQDQDINNSLQDAYDDIAVKCQCIIKSVTLNFIPLVNYYDFLTGNRTPAGVYRNQPVPDYLGTIGIFSNTTNLWLRDDLNIRDYDKIRIDWELWQGQSQYWTPHSLKYIAVVPKLYDVPAPAFETINGASRWGQPLWDRSGLGASSISIPLPSTCSFILWYWAQAPGWDPELDNVQEPLVALDMQDLFEYFATADLLESAEEPTKASIWWSKYLPNRESYKNRCRDNARADLLQRI